MLRAMTFALIFALLCVTTSGQGLEGAAEQDDRALAVLEGAREAMRSYESLSFDAEFRVVGTGTFEIASRSSDIQATFARTESGVIVRMEGDQSPAFGQPGLRILAIREGSDARWLDDQERQLVMAYGLRESRKAPSAFEEVIPRDVFGDEPFRNFENTGSFSYEGVEAINNIDCDILVHTNTRNNQAVRYFIARTDRLLRKIDTPIGELDSFPGSSITQTVTFKNIKVDAPINADAFEIAPPPGYSVSRRGRVPAENKPAARDRVIASAQIGTDPGDVAPDFQATDSNGNAISLLEMIESDKPTVVYFWSSWHARSRSLNTELAEMVESLGDNAPNVIGFAIRERDESAAAAAGESLGFPVVIGARDIADTYAVRAVPTVFVIDTEGKIVWNARTYEKATTIETLKGIVTAND